MKTKIKVVLYLEFYHFFGGFLYKKIGTGLLTSYRNQKKILSRMGVDYTESWDSSCDILQINTPWIWSLYLIKKARAEKKKVIIWSHVTAEDIKGVFRFSGSLSYIAKIYLTYTYNLADVIFAPSEYTKKLLIGYGIPASKIQVMSNGVDTEKFSQDEAKRGAYRASHNLDGIVVGTVGLAIPRKGVTTFLALAYRFSAYTFVWVGKIYNQILVPSIPKHVPKNASFTGYVDDILGAFMSLDIFLFPSYEENQGMVILEAAALGLPILVRDIPAYNGWLVHGKNCLKAANDHDFIASLHQLAENKELREFLGENAKNLAKHHSLDIMAAKTSKIYESLV